jgi:TolB-like protein
VLLKDGVRIELRRQAFDLLVYLVENQGRLVTKNECLERICEGRAVVENTLSQCIAKVRRALGDTGQGQKMIQTEYGEGFRFVAEVKRVIGAEPRSQGPETVAVGQRGPAIAVLAFENGSPDPEQVYFAEGISDDLRTRLTLWRRFPVISRSSSHAYRSPIDPKRVGAELDARYVVEGMVRKSSDAVRVNVQLTDAMTGTQIWADRYTGTLERVFELQDEISELIAAAIHPRLLQAASLDVMRRAPKSVDAWDQVLRGMWHTGKETAADNGHAREYYAKALELDPGFVLAASQLGWSYYHDLFYQWTDDWAKTLERIEWAAETCLRLDREDPAGYVLKGLLQMTRGRREEAIASMRLGLELNPNLAQPHSLLGQLLAMRGSPDEGRRHVETALRLSPKDRDLHMFYTGLALVEFCAEKYERAIDWAERALRLNPNYWIDYGCLAASHALLGQRSDAREAVRELQRRAPDFSVSKFEQLVASADPKYRESFRKGLELAGLRH